MSEDEIREAHAGNLMPMPWQRSVLKAVEKVSSPDTVILNYKK